MRKGFYCPNIISAQNFSFKLKCIHGSPRSHLVEYLQTNFRVAKAHEIPIYRITQNWKLELPEIG